MECCVSKTTALSRRADKEGKFLFPAATAANAAREGREPQPGTLLSHDRMHVDEAARIKHPIFL
jgi:hypothetical protein